MWRAVAVIVLGGAALGVVHNAAGLASRPSRGIRWLASQVELPSLESLAALDTARVAVTSDTAAVASTPATASAAATTAPASSAPPAAEAAPPAPPVRAKATAGTSPGASRAAASTPGEAPPTPPPATPSTAMPPPAPAAPFIPETDRPFQVTLATAKTLFDARAALFLDARDPSEFEAGHIPGAIRITRGEALGDPDRVKGLGPPVRPIVAYCEGGACESSHELAQALVDAGYRRVLVYTGGFPEWAAAGHPVEKGAGSP
jgi:rhodanese-related sulfurtransferase